MKKVKVIFALLAVSMMLACNTYQKQLNKFNLFADAHTNELAKKCVQYFPVKDSVGAVKVDSTHKAVNQNYESKIDSLQQLAASFQKGLLMDNETSSACSQVSAAYQSRVNDLIIQISKLKNAYRPCKPDTVFKTQTIYRTDEAALAVARNNFTSERDSLNLVKNNLKQEKETSGKRLTWLFILGWVILLSVAETVLKILGKF